MTFEICMIAISFCVPISGYGPGDIMIVLDWYLSDPGIRLK